jgi:hypothetical protein
VSQAKAIAMLKHPDDPRKESARRTAERKWRNHDLERRVKEERQKAESQPKKPKELASADVIEGKHDRRGSVTRAQTKFAKDISEMMTGHKKHSVAIYLYLLECRRKRLLVEKLRRLRLAHPNLQEG